MRLRHAAIALLLAAPVAAGPEELTIPRGTMFDVRIDSDLHSDKAKEGDTFKATVLSAVHVNGQVAVHARSTVDGVVSVVKSRGDGNPSSVLGLTFTKLHTAQGGSYDLDGALVGFRKMEPPREEPVLVKTGGEKAVVVIGKEGEGPGDRSSSVVGNAGEAEGALATRWALSGLSHHVVVIDAGSEMTFELRQDIKVQAGE